MNIIKRSGEEVEYDGSRIINAIKKANNDVPAHERLSDLQAKVIEEQVWRQIQDMTYAANVEEIQDMVIKAIMAQGAFELAKVYTEFRYKRMLIRKSNSTDDSILALLDQTNEELKQENSNKNPMIASTQRDYMAGEVSKDITDRLLLPDDIVKANNEAEIHFHDRDYFAMHIHNCDLINLDDMLQNGTVISGIMIDRPKSFATTCNIATQIVAQVASNQYGQREVA